MSASTGSRLVDEDWNATSPPLDERAGARLVPSPLLPESDVDTSVRSPSERSFTYTSWVWSASPGSRFVDIESNATTVPLDESAGEVLDLFPFVPESDREARVMSSVRRFLT